jgi:hypothetical protein
MREGDCSLTNRGARLLKQMVMIKVLRPDRFAASAGSFIKHVLGDEVMETAQADL